MNINYQTKNQIRIPLVLLVILFLSFLISACSEEKYSNIFATLTFQKTAVSFMPVDELGNPGMDVVSLVVFPSDFVITRVGENVQLKINAKLNNGSVSEDASRVSWSSSDTSIVLVDDKGRLSSVATGEASITATIENLSQTINVSVDDSDRTISGKVQYEDRAYNKNGLIIFTTTPYLKASRYVTIDLLDTADRIVKTVESNSTGDFDFGNIVFNQYTIRVLAQVENDVAPGFTIKDMDKNIYAVRYEPEAGINTHDIQIRDNNSSTSLGTAAGAFNILDVMTAGADFSRQVLGVDVHDLNVFWEKENEFGTYYCNAYDVKSCVNGAGIYVLSQHKFSFSTPEADYDEYDDDVLMHEYGHYVVENFAKDDSPGGCHNLTDNNLDLRLAWSEGLGTFFPIAIKDWLRKNNPSLMSMQDTEEVTLYLDTISKRTDPSVPIISFDIANFEDADPVTEPDLAEVYFYSSSEIAILKILWGLSQEFGMDRLWDIVENYFKQAKFPTSLATFWDGFINSSEFSNTELTALQSIFNERKVFYQEDGFESDDILSDATLVNLSAIELPEHHIYKDTGEADIDLFAFDSTANTTYVVQTQELRNGVDTKIRILDEQGALVVNNGNTMENDDANPDSYKKYDSACFGGSNRIYVDKTSLASSLTFNPQNSAKYYVEVSRLKKFSYDSDFTGHYGSYQLSIVAQ